MAGHHGKKARQLIAARKAQDPFADMDTLVNQINENLKGEISKKDVNAEVEEICLSGEGIDAKVAKEPGLKCDHIDTKEEEPFPEESCLSSWDTLPLENNDAVKLCYKFCLLIYILYVYVRMILLLILMKILKRDYQWAFCIWSLTRCFSA